MTWSPGFTEVTVGPTSTTTPVKPGDRGHLQRFSRRDRHCRTYFHCATPVSICQGSKSTNWTRLLLLVKDGGSRQAVARFSARGFLDRKRVPSSSNSAATALAPRQQDALYDGRQGVPSGPATGSPSGHLS